MNRAFTITLFVLFGFANLLAQDSTEITPVKPIWLDIGSLSWPNNGYAFSFTLLQDSTECDFSEFKGFIEGLGRFDTLRIDFSSHGCFHWDKFQMNITRPYDYFVESHGEKEFLSNEWLNMILGLEAQIANTYHDGSEKKGACTTTSTLTMTLNNRKMIFYDQSCEWEGWDQLHALRKTTDNNR